MYDIVSSPNKDSTKLTLKLSRVKSNESDSAGQYRSWLSFFPVYNRNQHSSKQQKSKSVILVVS